MSSAFAQVEWRLRMGGAARSTLRTELGACGSLSRAEDRAELLEALQALVGGAVQYDGQTGAPLSVRQLCGLLLEGARNGSHPEAYFGLRLAVQVSTLHPRTHTHAPQAPACTTRAPAPLPPLSEFR